VIIDLPSTNSSKINRALVDLREQGGSITLGRVLTLVIITDESAAEDPIAAANAASFEHPCRVIVVARGARRASPRMDAQIRVGGDAGASEVVVLRLYGTLVDHGASVVVPLLLADAPVVAWWPGDAPVVPADDPIGELAQRRITDAAASKRPGAQLTKRIASYRPGDTDLSWTRITRWRGLLASTMDQPPHDKVTSASVAGAADSPSADLLAAWLAVALKCPVKRIKSPAKSGPGLHSVILSRRAGDISMVRPQTITAELRVGNQPTRHVALPRRGLRDCLAEELRRLDADEVYAEVLSKGLALVGKHSEAPKAGAVATEAGSTPTKAGSTATKGRATKGRATKGRATKGRATKAPARKATETKATETNGKPPARRTRRAKAPAPGTVASEAASPEAAAASSNGGATKAAPSADPTAVSSAAPESGRAPRRRRAARSASTS
jgi:glucose-6-phosphate dehydrogenase assembly protein OpcA